MLSDYRDGLLTALGPAPENTAIVSIATVVAGNTTAQNQKFKAAELYFQRDFKDNYPITFVRHRKEITLRTQNYLNKVVNDSNLTNKEIETFLRTISADTHFTKIYQNVTRPARKTWLIPTLIDVNIHNIPYATKSHGCFKGLYVFLPPDPACNSAIHVDGRQQLPTLTMMSDVE